MHIDLSNIDWGQAAADEARSDAGQAADLDRPTGTIAYCKFNCQPVLHKIRKLT